MKTLQERTNEIIQAEDVTLHGTHLKLCNLYSSEIGKLISPYKIGAVPALIVSFESYAKALRKEHPLSGILADALSQTFEVETTTRKEVDDLEDSSP